MNGLNPSLDSSFHKCIKEEGAFFSGSGTNFNHYFSKNGKRGALLIFSNIVVFTTTCILVVVFLK